MFVISLKLFRKSRNNPCLFAKNSAFVALLAALLDIYWRIDSEYNLANQIAVNITIWLRLRLGLVLVLWLGLLLG